MDEPILETITNLLTDYAHRRGGQPVNLGDREVAAGVALALVEALTAPEGKAEIRKAES